MSDLIQTRLVYFLLFTVVLLAVSWRSLCNPRTHGFYRFFVFEGVLALVLINDSMGPSLSPMWLEWVAKGLNTAAAIFVSLGFYRLVRMGGNKMRHTNPENLLFENTERLVKNGIYRYIRHPMYSALLLTAWGFYLDYLTLYGLPIVLVTTVFVFISAKVEERENLEYFGHQYEEYMRQSRKFIPFIF